MPNKVSVEKSEFQERVFCISKVINYEMTKFKLKSPRNQWELAQILVNKKSILVGIFSIEFAQLNLIEKLASKSMKVGKLCKFTFG